MEKKIKDSVGQEVFENDMVVYVKPYSHSLAIGRVLRVTPKGVAIEENPNNKYGLNRPSHQIVKIAGVKND